MMLELVSYERGHSVLFIKTSRMIIDSNDLLDGNFSISKLLVYHFIFIMLLQKQN
nr:hypothetical protein [Mycoplasmopsis bovis]